MNQVRLTLGDFVFADTEIPERIVIGGEQRLALHKMVGGARVIDAMGRDDAPLEWRGLMRGADALARVRYLDGLRIAGNQLVLSWSELQYMVVVKDFRAEFEREYQIPYHISCEVVQDLTTPVTTIAGASIDSLMQQDMAQANLLGGQIGDGPLSSTLASLDGAIKSVSSFAKAAQSTINSVLLPLADVQARVRLLIGTVGNTVSNISTIGGILPHSSIAQQAAKLNSQVGAMIQLPQLYNLQSVLGRMGGNLGTLGAGSSGAMVVPMAGGNLYQVAARQYGDAAEWTAIANANRISDPMISGLQNIKIPPIPDGNNGILSA